MRSEEIGDPTQALAESKPQSLVQAVAGALQRLVPGGSRVVIAVSGGPDSMALLLAWGMLQGIRRDQLLVAHFDHHLRPQSAADAEFVRSFAEQHGLPFCLGAAERSLAAVPNRSTETAARDARYAFLEEAARETGAQFVATGHNADDQVETVLHAVVRGTGLAGLAGMKEERTLAPGVQLVRPLLQVRRQTVEEFLAANDQSARLDQSNDDCRFTRNRIRHELLPLLRASFNPRVDDAVLRLAGIAAGWQPVLAAAADKLLDEAIIAIDKDHVELRASQMQAAPRVLAAEAFRRLLERQGWPRGRVGRAALNRLVDMVHADGPPRLELPAGLTAMRSGQPAAQLSLYRQPDQAPAQKT